MARPKMGTARRWRQVNGRGFLPSDLVYGAAWFTSEQKVYSDTGATTPITANGAIAAWVDVISGISVVQSSFSLRPLWLVNQINGRPAASFDGGDLLRSASTTALNVGTQSLLEYVVVSQAILTGTQIITAKSAGNTGDGRHAILSEPTGPNYFVNSWSATSAGTNVANVAALSTAWRSQATIIDRHNSLLKSRIAGVQVDSDAIPADTANRTNTSPLTFGAISHTNLFFLTGLIAEAIYCLYPSTSAGIAQMDTDIPFIEAYIRNTYGAI